MWQEQTHNKQVASKHKQSFDWLVHPLLTPGGMMAYLPITVIIIIIFIGSSWMFSLPSTDSARYQCYALTFWLGSGATTLLPASQCSFLSISSPQGAFHMLPLEYPPLTLLPFSLALLVPLPYYQLAIAFLMSLIALLIYTLLLHYGPRGAGLAFAIYLLIGGGMTAQIRFDLIPAALTILCVILAERKHWSGAYVALAFGVLLKLYPLLFLPALFIAEQQAYGKIHIPGTTVPLRSIPAQLWYTLCGIRRWRWSNLLLCLDIILGITGLFALLNFQGAIVNQLSYFVNRPMQVEATGSTLLWLAKWAGVSFTINYAFGSLNILSSLSDIVSHISTILFIGGSLYTFWLQWRGRLDVTQAIIALLFVFIATGKVFSPQYLIWLMPLLAYAGAFDTFWFLCWGTVSVLTAFFFLRFYTYPVDTPASIPLLPGFFETTAIRNCFFVLITIAYLADRFNMRQRKLLPSLSPGKKTRPL